MPRRKNCLWENYKRHWKSVVATTSLRITNNILSKLIGEVSYRDHKKTWQEVLNAFLHYLYNTYMVCANDK